MKGSKIISFVAGAAIGSVVTWYITKTKYQQINEAEAESFRKKLKELMVENEKKEEKALDPKEVKRRNTEEIESLLKSVRAVQEKHEHVNYSDVEDDSKEGVKHIGSEDVSPKIDIEEITYEQWDDDNSGFEHYGMTVYSDGVFTDDADQIMSEGYLSETIGIDMRDKIVESDLLDAVYVRNHKSKRDYEVIHDLNTYDEVHS